MKIRQGFVSNSSSTSFVIAVKQGQEEEATIKIEVEVPITDFQDHYYTKDDKEETYFETYQQYYDHLWNNYYWNGKGGEDEKEKFEEAHDEELSKAKEAFANGMRLMMCRVSTDSCDAVQNMICETGTEDLEFKNCIVIEHGDPR